MVIVGAGVLQRADRDAVLQKVRLKNSRGVGEGWGLCWPVPLAVQPRPWLLQAGGGAALADLQCFSMRLMHVGQHDHL